MTAKLSLQPNLKRFTDLLDQEDNEKCLKKDEALEQKKDEEGLD